MSNFIDNFKKFISKNWNSPEEQEIVDYLRVNSGKITGDEMSGITFVEDFISSNKFLFDLTSDDFKREMENLDSDFLTENDEGYHGYWDETALLISFKSKNPKDHKDLSSDIIRQIKELAKEYGTMIQSTDAPQRSLILPRISLSQIKSFENDLKHINKNLIISLHQTNRNFNIADKVNNGIIAENKNTMNKTIRVGLKNWDILVEGKKIIVKEGKNTYTPFTYSTGQVVWDAPHVIPHVIKEEVSNISFNLVKENDTSDINVPEMPATNSEALKRVSRFDPYGNAQNVVKGSKSKVKFDKLEFKESVKKFKDNKIYILDDDLTEDTGMYANMLIECKNKQHHIIIDKKDLNTFVRRNCAVKDYIKESVFDFNKYMSSRPRGFVNEIIKEYFESQNNELNDLHIDSVERTEDGKIMILYYFDQDVESTDVTMPEEEFFIFCQQNDPNVEDYVFPEQDGNDDHPMGMGMYFDEEMYWLNGDTYDMAKKYVEQKVLNK